MKSIRDCHCSTVGPSRVSQCHQLVPHVGHSTESTVFPHIRPAGIILLGPFIQRSKYINVRVFLECGYYYSREDLIWRNMVSEEFKCDFSTNYVTNPGYSMKRQWNIAEYRFSKFPAFLCKGSCTKSVFCILNKNNFLMHCVLSLYIPSFALVREKIFRKKLYHIIKHYVVQLGHFHMRRIFA